MKAIVQILYMGQLAKEELGINHKMNISQDWPALTEEAKLRLDYISRMCTTKQVK